MAKYEETLLSPFKAAYFFLIVMVFVGAGNAELVRIDVTGTVGFVEGSFSSGLASGQSVLAAFTYNTDEQQAGPDSRPFPSDDPGHEFSSFYDFQSPPYGAVINFPSIPSTFESTTAALVVNDNLDLTSVETNGFLDDGTYDWIEVLGATTLELQNGYPADGMEWTLAFVSDKSWIVDGSLIPDSLPENYIVFIVGIEFDTEGNEIGLAWVSVDTIDIDGPICTDYPIMDANRDCKVNLIDFAVLASEWMTCNLNPVEACE